MYICVCNAVTEADIRNAAADGVRNLKQLARLNGCGKTCGCCKKAAIEALVQAVAEERTAQNMIPVM